MLEKFGGWPTLLSDLCDGKNLTAEKTESVLSEILSGEADPSRGDCENFKRRDSDML